MLTLLSVLLSLAGFAALAAAMPRHHRQLWRGAAPTQLGRLLRLAGWLWLGLSLPACLADWGVRIGWVVWCGLLTTAALAVVLLLAWRGKRA